MNDSITKPRAKRQSKVERACGQCETVFLASPSRIKIGSDKYCSRGCADLARRNRTEHKCPQCGKLFILRPSEVGGKYCSRDCYSKSRPQLINCICKQCGIEFTRRPSEGNGLYCSKQCQGIALRGENHPRWRGGHSNYRGKNWSQQRKLAYARDRGICQYCGVKSQKGKSKNSVHHIKRFSDFNGDYISANQLTNLITLCQPCHMKAENGRIPIQPHLF